MKIRILPWALIVLLAGLTSARAITTNFFEGFEASLTNWVVGDGNPGDVTAYWGRVNFAFGGEETHDGAFKAYCAGVGFEGTATEPLYRNEMDAFMSRSINLAGYTNATLSFWYKTPGIETEFDFASVSIDGTTVWLTDQPQAEWTLIAVSLESYLGGSHTLTFRFTSDDSVNDKGWYLDDITLTDEATPAPPPANDDFENAQVITGSIGSVGGSNSSATPEGEEPSPGNSVWYQWTPHTNGVVTFFTRGSSFDTFMCVYTGAILAELVPIGCDDNSDTNGASRLSFDAVAGTTYSISIRSTFNSAGFLLLNWEQPNGGDYPGKHGLTADSQSILQQNPAQLRETHAQRASVNIHAVSS